MKRFRSIFIVLTIGSLWGFFEALPLPTGLLTGLGVFFLLWGRQLVNVPGSSVAAALLVCVYKAYSFHFSACQWAGVLALVIPFDAIASYWWRNRAPAIRELLVTGSASSLIALPGFLIAVLYIVPEPFWIDGGWQRIAGYALRTTLPSFAIALTAAPASLYAANAIVKPQFRTQLATGLATAAIVIVWCSPFLKL